MLPAFRWFGPDDPVPLRHIRQIPGVETIVSALYDIPVGQAWPTQRIEALAESIGREAMTLGVIESIPVHEDIKLGRPDRERFVDAFCESVEAMGRANIPVLCYNFMPVFDWTRTDLAQRFPDGSTGLAYDDAALSRMDLSKGTSDLPGWATAYDARTLAELRAAYSDVDSERLWENLAWFLQRVVPVAETAGVVLALHPDDPPWPIFGLPRIIVDEESLARVLSLVDARANGLTLCTGSLGASESNDLPAIARRFGATGRIYFAHCRNVRRTGTKQFHESPHPSRFGDVDMHAVLSALHETGFRGPMRPDHGRMIWGEEGRAGYGLYDRALGVTYLQGLWEAIDRRRA